MNTELKGKTLPWSYVTPIQGRNKIALFKFNQWIEVHQGEVLLVHQRFLPELLGMGFELTDKPKVYQNKKMAELGIGDNGRVVQ